MGFEITPKLSELAGIFAADGSMQRGHVCFWGNPESDRSYYDCHLKYLFWKTFNIKIRPHDKKSNSVYGFYICNRNVIEFFHNILGFPIGKKTYSLEVPKLIYQTVNNEVISAFLRGFFAGDGCLNFDKRYGNCQEILRIIHTYPRIQIKCVSRNIIYQLSDMLRRLDLRNFVTKSSGKKKNEVDSYMIQVSGKLMLERWVNKVGFSNPNHSSRYEIFKKYGLVPPNTSYKERIKLLKGLKSPWYFYPTWARSSAWIER